MSIDKDSSGSDTVTAVDRPPAIAEHLWNLIDPECRKKVRRDAAMGLRRGVHPETVVIDHLRSQGWAPEDIVMVAASGGSSYHPDDNDDYDPFDDPFPVGKPSSGPVAPLHVQKEERSVAEPSRKLRAPAWPYGTAGFKMTPMPIGDIGNLLHYERGMDAETAAAIEWKVLRGISRDPAFVQRDLGNIRFLGADLPKDILQSIRGAVVHECECVIEDIRSRRSKGDVTAMFWIDPKDSIFDAADLFS